MLKFSWGRGSAKKLKTVHDDLVFVVTKALKDFSAYDVGIADAIRTLAYQKTLVASGASHTLKSRHIGRYAKTIPKFPRRGNEKGIDMLVSHAIDIGAYKPRKDGGWTLTEEVDYFYSFAEAMRIVAIKYDVSVVWGGFWKDLRNVTSIKTEMDRYIARCKKEKRDPFKDLGHYHLGWKDYPASAKKVAR